MRLLRKLSKKTLLIVSLSVLGFGLAFILLRSAQHNSLSPTANSSTSHKQIAKPKLATFGLPARLKIPKISVDALIDPMGLLPNGDMEAPNGPINVGWYKYGVRPGETGSSVIDGHYGTWKDGQGSVFDNLNKLQPGDNIYVQDQKGVTSTFVVREFKTYGPNEIVPAVFRSNDAKAHLNLITCQGTWNQVQASYSNRLVVFADKAI